MGSRDMDLSLRDYRVRTSNDSFAGSVSAEGKETVMQGLHGGAQGHPRNKEAVGSRAVFINFSHCCDQMPERVNLWEEGFSGFLV